MNQEIWNVHLNKSIPKRLKRHGKAVGSEKAPSVPLPLVSQADLYAIISLE